jgi:glycerol-3-phosphate dehydrogenase (NAD(P)+)
MKVSVLGCGRWGSFIGWYLNGLGNDVCQWGTEGHYTYDVLKNTGKNEYVELAPEITLTSDLERAINHAEIVIISINAQSLRKFMERIVVYDVKDKIFVLCMKGIEVNTGNAFQKFLLKVV